MRGGHPPFRFFYIFFKPFQASDPTRASFPGISFVGSELPPLEKKKGFLEETTSCFSLLSHPFLDIQSLAEFSLHSLQAWCGLRSFGTSLPVYLPLRFEPLVLEIHSFAIRRTPPPRFFPIIPSLNFYSDPWQKGAFTSFFFSLLLRRVPPASLPPHHRSR